MAYIKSIKDSENNIIFPITHERAVRDDSGNTIESKIQLLHEVYTALTQSSIVPVASSDWPLASLEEHTIYRVAGTTSYTDYMYDGTTAIPMATYDNAIDNVPTEDSNNLVKSGGVFEKIKALGNYYKNASTAAQTLTSKYIVYTNGNITDATSTTTFTVAFYEIPTSTSIDSVSVYIPKTPSTASSLYGFTNSLSATSVSGRQGRGDAASQTLSINIAHNYVYLVVAYNSTNGAPTVRFHEKEVDLSDIVLGTDISADYSKTFGRTDLLIYGEYIDKDGALKTGYNAFRRSDYLPIYKAASIVVSCDYTSTSATIVTFYNSSKTRISGILANSQSAQTYTIPNGTYYIIISNKDNGVLSVSVSSTGVKGFNATVNEDTLELERIKKYTFRDHYNILYVGNSFTNNSTEKIPRILNSIGVNNVNLTKIYTGGAGLDTYAGYLSNNTSLSADTVRGVKIANDGNLVSILSHDWDVIIFQQVSASAGNYASYTPSLAKLINAAKKYCTNPNMKIGFGVIWSTYATTFANIIAAERSLMQDYNIDILIPLGTAVENARLTSMAENANSFSSDQNIQHLADGVGRYVAACSLYCAVIKPFTGIDIYQDETSTIETSGSLGEVAVTADNRELCQKCAEYANIYPYATLNLENY